MLVFASGVGEEPAALRIARDDLVPLAGDSSLDEVDTYCHRGEKIARRRGRHRTEDGEYAASSRGHRPHHRRTGRLAGRQARAHLYDLRSTFASRALDAGVSVFALARAMGTSVRMIERRYGTLLGGAAAGIASRLDAYDAAQEKATDRATEGDA